MNLKSKELFSYIKYLESQIKTNKSKDLKNKLTKQKTALIHLLLNNK
jgi:CRISPR/Cas system CSM-associated protein Csm2 small subunit